MDIRRVDREMIPPADASHNAASVEIERRRQEERQREKRRQQQHTEAATEGAVDSGVNAATYNADGHLQDTEPPIETPPHSIDFRA